jgi:hypothetical protein
MNTFQKVVLVIAVVVLLIGFIMVGISLKKSTAPSSTKEPSACPDFWYSSYYKPCVLSTYGCCDDKVTSSDATGSNCTACDSSTYGCCPDGVRAKTSATDTCTGVSKCWNVNEVGRSTTACQALTSGFDPADKFEASGGKSSLCKKQEWADECYMAWEGVTNVKSDC